MRHLSDFEFRWADSQDEPDIRALVGSVSMPGTVAVRFAREPDYFLGTGIMGDPCQVLTARHQPDGMLAGIACRAEHRAFLNGVEATLGYIGQIRIAPAYRGRWLVNVGAEWFKEASLPGLLYFGVISRENPGVSHLLAGPRPPAGLFTRRLCGLTSCSILLRPSKPCRNPDLEVSPASTETLAEITAFLRLNGPKRQFFPAYTVENFNNGTTLRGLNPQDIMVARRGKAITGVMAVWDQAAYKQDVVESYSPALKRLRLVYNLATRALGARPLTLPGQAIRLAFASHICIEQDDPLVIQALLQACVQHAYQLGKAFLMLGLADNDPLLPVAKRYFHIPYHSDLFAVSWSEEAVRVLDGRIPYIEIATL